MNVIVRCSRINSIPLRITGKEGGTCLGRKCSNSSLTGSKLSQSTVRCLYTITSIQSNTLRCNKWIKCCNSDVIVSSHGKVESLGRRSFASDADYPSHVKVPLPALSPTMEMGTIISWEKKEGDKLNEGDLLAEIETDKATMGFETPEEGYLAKVLVPAGSKDVPIGQLLCIIVEDEGDIEKFKDYVAPSGPIAVKPKETAAPPPAPKPSSAPSASVPAASVPRQGSRGVAGRLFASPLAKRVASEQGLDLTSIGSGSGPGGRIIAADLSALASGDSALASVGRSGQPVTDIQLTGMRRAIATRLTESKQTIPHYYLVVDVLIDQLLRLREDVNSSLSEEGLKISVNDLIIKASALSCLKVPEVNSSWQGSFIRQYNTVDIGIAVSTPGGLITPIIFDADSKGLSLIAREMKTLAVRGREGKLTPSEFQGATFTISNLGMFGINSFSAVINPPNSSILAVGSAVKKLVPGSTGPDGRILPRVASVITTTLSCDHRVVDGAVGAQWLQQFKNYLENPFRMML